MTDAHIAEPLRRLSMSIADLTPDPANARKHGPRNLDAIKASLVAFGQRKPVVVQAEGMIVRAGNGTLEAAKALGWETIAAVVLDDDNATASQFAIADNRTAELAEWDDETLASLLDGMDEPTRDMLAFDDKELAGLMRGLEPDEIVEDEAPEPPADPVTQPGDLWTLGKHRLLCGDSTNEEQVGKLLGQDTVDCIVTDPPYCSGGFQESGKSVGSVGTAAKHKHVANDRLSTRGFQKLLKSAFCNMNADYLYSFTDWRMWIWLFDVVESAGLSVRSMITWDKGTPGMGRGWRAQHELVMWAAKGTPPFGKGSSGAGNVIKANRTGNQHHTTEKPVSLVARLVEVVPFCANIGEPFAGSGTTLIACEQLGRRCFAIEIDPAYCDVIVQRWENLTGQKAVRNG